ncbi:hypothetical protein [Kineosporia babensis]|uniref:Uncharacterized protein n=1 Tax=Kineosporia babensis TaxID=499548 RepID=A0A9X1NIQ2_9ACTN|nr:hypothetical protein [Kineosporia babensis]MCD5314805.1 hypothetical protein [Kineosporia babensis]
MQIIESTDFGVRSAVYRVRRRFAPLQFDLYPMLHVGRPEYYAEVQRRLREVDVVIAEGIHDGTQGDASDEPEAPGLRDLLTDADARGQVLVSMLTAGYQAIPADQQHGLVVQPDDLDGGRAEVIRPDVSAGQIGERFQTISPVRRVAALAAIGSVAVAQRLIGPRMTRYQLRHATLDDQPSVAEILAPDYLEHLTRVLIDERDEPLLEVIDELIETRGKEDITVAITYGARHMRAVINHLYAQKFRVVDSEWLTVTSWTEDEQ